MSGAGVIVDLTVPRRTELQRWPAALLLAVTPAVAWGHGEQLVFLPFGTLLALASVVVLAIALRGVDIAWRVLAVVVALVVAVPSYLLVDEVPTPFFESDVFWFVIGVVPSLALPTLLLLWRRRIRRARP